MPNKWQGGQCQSIRGSSREERAMSLAGRGPVVACFKPRYCPGERVGGRPIYDCHFFRIAHTFAKRCNHIPCILGIQHRTAARPIINITFRTSRNRAKACHHRPPLNSSLWRPPRQPTRCSPTILILSSCLLHTHTTTTTASEDSSHPQQGILPVCLLRPPGN